MKKLLYKVFKDKAVLVTGHTGFKGSWLSLWLEQLGAEVIGYALDPYTPFDNFALAGLKDRVIDIRGDIRDIHRLQKTMDEYNPEFVFHLAAQPIVRLSYEKPFETYEINVMGTLNILECIKNSNSVKIGIMVTSDKCYDNREQIWGYRETDPMGGYDPYSSSKGCSEILISSYRNSYMNPKDYKNHGKSISSVRAGNVIGGGDWSFDRLVPDCIRSLIKGKAVRIRNPLSVRPWQHVLDPLYGYLLLAAKMYDDGVNYSGPWNFGPDQSSIVPVSTLAETLIEKWGSGNRIDLPGENAPHEASMLSLDCTKAKVRLGWKPALDLDCALEFTVEWYKNYLREDCYSLCKSQIDRYMLM